MSINNSHTHGHDSPFPEHGILPKEEIGATSFLRDHPEHDGRGIVVAIFDTGVDVGVEGLQVTTDGKRKIIDAIDSTGSGDVDMTSTCVVEGDSAAIITGLTGRRFKIDPTWNNDSKKYRVGIKRLYELFPSPLKKRLTKKRREHFDQVQHTKITALQQRISECDKTGGDDLKLEKQELEEQLTQLQEMIKSWQDPGPMVDCIMWKDDSDQEWRVVVYTAPELDTEWQQMINVAKQRAVNDTKTMTEEESDDGKEAETVTASKEEEEKTIIDLSGHKVLKDYVLCQDYSHFADADHCNFSVKIYEDGNILSIVTCAGSHGTHVAGIVGAHYPDNPELNGVAPGVQFITVKIGDSRLGSMETGTGLVRGLIAAYQHKVHVINMSYGEGSTLPNSGRFKRLVDELVHKHNVVFVCSAGNNGPALSTLGSPGGDYSSMIGVGAYVSPSMMAAQYSLLHELPENQYSWSSRGPAPDGHHGVSVSACGGAIAPVPEYQLSKNQLMNGTSMSSPCCSGGIALLLSAMRANNKSWNPYYIKTLIENSARVIPSIDPLALGCGLMQVDKAYTLSETYTYDPAQNMWYEVSLPERRNARGIYLRNYRESRQLFITRVSVTPNFHEDVDNSAKIKFEKRFQIVTTQPWIKAPTHLMLANETKGIQVQVDPTGLSEGSEAHYGEVLFIDVNNKDAGPVIRVPVTVIKPLQVEQQVIPDEDKSKENDDENQTRCVLKRDGLRFKPGHIDRLFVTVPSNANMVKIKLKAVEMDSKRLFYVHLLQIVAHENLHDTEMKKLVGCIRDDEHKFWFKVMPESTLEVCLAQFWSSLGESVVDVDLEFIGVHALDHGDVVHFDGSDVVQKVTVQTSLKSLQSLQFKCELKELRQHLRPKSSEISAPTDKRNTLMNGNQVFELINTYEFDVKESLDCFVLAPTLEKLLYESEFESQLMMIFDSNKKLIHTVDAFPRRYKFKLVGKGTHTVRMQIRHEKIKQLEKMKQHPIIIARQLSKAVPVTLYRNRSDALLNSGTNKVGKKVKLHTGKMLTLFAASPSDSALPKEASSGDRLCGRLQFKRQGGDVTSIEFQYTVPTRPKTDDKKKDENKDLEKKLEKLDDRSIEEKLDEVILDQKIKFATTLLQQIKDKVKNQKELSDFEKVMNVLMKDHSTELKVLNLKLQSLNQLPKDADQDEAAFGAREQEIINVADQIVNAIDLDKLAIHMATLPKTKDGADNKNDFVDEQEMLEYTKKCKDMDKQKTALIGAIKEKLLCLLKSKTAKKGEEHDRQIKSTMRQLRQYQDTSTDKFLSLETEYDLHFGRHGNVLKKVNKALKNGAGSGENDKTLVDQRISTLLALGWDHWVAHMTAWRLIDFPAKYPLF